ncbi:MAG: hypothetical protein ACI39E_06790 [Acutalibacteraceae bacterium]
MLHYARIPYEQSAALAAALGEDAMLSFAVCLHCLQRQAAHLCREGIVCGASDAYGLQTARTITKTPPHG